MYRDYRLKVASERNITKPVYIIHINKISDHWVKLYMETKAKRLKEALAKGYLPKLCLAKEHWHDRKCRDYCAVAENCPYGRMVKHSSEIKFAA